MVVARKQLTATCLSLAAFVLHRGAYGQSVSVCPTAPSTTTVYVIQSVYISTYVQQNTTIAINDYLTLTVDNAPTNFDDVVVGTSTSTISSVPEA